MISRRASDVTFLGLFGLLFLVCTALTISIGSTTALMDSMPMPGGWTMSMTWMPGQNGPRAMLSFLGMWVTMMIAMMLPSLVPMLWQYRKAVRGSAAVHLELLTCLVTAGYFLPWGALGIAAFPIGVTLAALAMYYPGASDTVPAAIGVLVLAVGVFQFSAWKSRHLNCCRSAGAIRKTDGPFRHGLRLGMHCVACCSNLTLLLLVVGVMDLRLMLLVTVAMTAERLAGERVARGIGVLVAGAGLFLIVRAIGIQI